MMRQSFFIWGALVAALCIQVSSANATPITYNINVTVASVSGGGGYGPAFQFSVPIPPPQTISGTYIADDITPGPITALNLNIGGVDIATEFPRITLNLFNPTSNTLNYVAFDGDCNPLCSTFGFFSLGGQPTALAEDTGFNTTLFVDWSGPYSAAPQPPAAVPEPATLLLLSTGLLGLAGYRWSQRRREGTHVG